MVNLIRDNERGDLMAFDTIDIPFYVKRIFVVNNVPIGEIRGKHCHKENLQFLVCISGKIGITFVTLEGKSYYIELTKGQHFLINTMQFAEQKYLEENTSIMVLCSHEYDKNDYITDFEEFKRLTN